MAVEAAERAIEAAGIDRNEIDVLVLGTLSPDYLLPATAAAVQARLKLNCAAMDLSAACAGFMYAMITGMQFVAAGTSKYTLVIGADTNSRVMNPADKKTYPLFGDGAGAAVLTADGALIDDGFATEHGLKVGSTLSVTSLSGKTLDLTVSGIEQSPVLDVLGLGPITISHAAFDATFEQERNRLTFADFDPYSRQPAYKGCAVRVRAESPADREESPDPQPTAATTTRC